MRLFSCRIGGDDFTAFTRWQLKSEVNIPERADKIAVSESDTAVGRNSPSIEHVEFLRRYRTLQIDGPSRQGALAQPCDLGDHDLSVWPLVILPESSCFDPRSPQGRVFLCLDPQATIGGGLYIAHIGGIHINPQAIIGSNCDIAHRVTIGASAMGRQGAPVVGDRVYIGTGATLAGKIKIGDGAKIAANTLVMSNIPAGATVMGVPGRIVMRAPKAALKTESAAPETIHAH